LIGIADSDREGRGGLFSIIEIYDNHQEDFPFEYIVVPGIPRGETE
jgi:hypothetical protein